MIWDNFNYNFSIFVYTSFGFHFFVGPISAREQYKVLKFTHAKSICPPGSNFNRHINLYCYWISNMDLLVKFWLKPYVNLCFLATIVALHFTPVSESVSESVGIVSDKRSLELASLFCSPPRMYYIPYCFWKEHGTTRIWRRWEWSSSPQSGRRWSWKQQPWTEKMTISQNLTTFLNDGLNLSDEMNW